MPIGPIEVMVLAFPDSERLNTIAGELESLVDSEKIVVIDAIVVSRSIEGTVEARDLEADEVPGFERIVPDPRDLISDADAASVGDGLAPGTVALVLAVEYRWAREFYERIRAADGEVTLHLQIDHDDAVAALAD